MVSKKLLSIICAGASVLTIGVTTLSAEETDTSTATDAPAETGQESAATADPAMPGAPAVPVVNNQEDPVNIDEKFEDTEGTIVVNSEEAETVILPAPEREGYTFVHWNSAKDDSGTVYQAGDEFTIGTEDELYAIWEKDEVKTIFYVEPDGENVVGTNEIVEYQKAETDEEKAQAIQGNPEASAASTEAPEASASASAEATEAPSASPSASANAEAIQ